MPALANGSRECAPDDGLRNPELAASKDVDGRVKPGHDGRESRDDATLFDILICRGSSKLERVDAITVM